MAKSKAIATVLYLASFAVLVTAVVLCKDVVGLIGTDADSSAYFEAGIVPAGVCWFVAGMLSIVGERLDPSPLEINWDELP